MKIYIFVQERKRRGKGETKILTVQQRASPLLEGKKCGHAGLGTEKTVIYFQSEIQLSVFWPGLFLSSMNKVSPWLIHAPHCFFPDNASKFIFRTNMENVPAESEKKKKKRKAFRGACVWLQQNQHRCQAELAQWCLSLQAKPSHNRCSQPHVEKTRRT